ncbi:hypothetical protein AB0I28_23045 [Phytomonospora sp. NPDC050363]|uniref:hypothetical protein n=1 Tax=Phytomonospora sp. NPDC050363 TaxID=3155642 RepID=UPI0033D779CF
MPLSRVEAFANDLELAGEFRRLHDLDRGARIDLTPAQAAEIRAADKATARRLMKTYGVKRLSINLLDGVEYLQAERRPEAFYAEALAIVTDYRLGAMKSLPPPWEYEDEEIAEFEENGFEDFDEPFDIADYKRRQARLRLDDYPHAEFTMTVKDTGYVEHLDRGIHFATAIYGEYGWD